MTISVATAPECAWTAAVTAPWITRLTPGAGQGPASLVVEAAPNGGPPRSAVITIADQTFTLLQASGCSYSIEPLSLTAPSHGAALSVTVTTHDGCAWDAVSQAPWIAVEGGAAGSGTGTVALTVAENATPPRQGSVIVAGHTVRVEQASGCTYEITPDSIDVPADGGEATVLVRAGAGCLWSATSTGPWVAIVSAPGGAGDGAVTVRAAANTGPPRTGTVAVEGQVVTIHQASGCSYAVSPPMLAFGLLGGTGTASITTAPGCTWRATTQDSWIRLVSDGQGTGSGSITIGVGLSFATRTGTVTIEGQRLSVRQN